MEIVRTPAAVLGGPTRSAVSELNLAFPSTILGLVLVPYANRNGWGDLTPLGHQ